MLAAISAGTVRPILFYEGVFSTGTLRLTSAQVATTWDGQTWLAAGDLLTVSPAKETTSLRAEGFTVQLNGEADTLISANLGAWRQGLRGTVWLAALDASEQIVPEPFVLFRGRADKNDFVDDAVQAKLSGSYESSLIDLQRPRDSRYTDQDQRALYPTDRGFEFTGALQNANIVWGNAGVGQLARGVPLA